MTALDVAPSTAPRVPFPSGTIIFREGEPGETMYIVLDGVVNVLVGETRIATVGPGGIIGEMAVINKQPRSATAIAETACLLTPIDAEQFNAVIQQMPTLAVEVLDALSERLRRATTRLSDQGRPFDPHIRIATPDDLPTIRTIVDQAIRVLAAGDYSQQQIESALHYLGGVDTPQLIEDGTYYVVEVNGQIAGCGGWSQRKALFHGDQDEAVPAAQYLDPAQDAAKIRQFYIHPRWARRGLARRLLQTCEQAVLAAGFNRLELMATLTGEPLYAAFGFKPIERTNITLPDGMIFTAVRMEKKLAVASAA